jgi:uncharacterized protein (TIGR03435 family)
MTGAFLAPLVVVVGVAAQSQGPRFEVASVKLNKSGPTALQRVLAAPGDRVTINNVSLRILVQVAYRLSAEQITSGPSWMDEDRFDIIAKAEAPSTVDQLRLMLQSLLRERFKLAVHMQQKSTETYALVMARGDGKLGSNLRPALRDCAALRASATTGDIDPCGSRTLANALITGRIGVRGVDLNSLTGILSRDAGRPIVNNTGLTGAFDVELAWTPQQFLRGPFNRERFPNVDPNGPSIFTAVQEQLGLKLESQRGAVEVLVIDAVDHPTED